jgi:hypothetical protein
MLLHRAYAIHVHQRGVARAVIFERFARQTDISGIIYFVLIGFARAGNFSFVGRNSSLHVERQYCRIKYNIVLKTGPPEPGIS